jgi:hypothetical protein
MSKRASFMVAAFVCLALGSALGAASAQTVPDIPGAPPKEPGDGLLRPVTGSSPGTRGGGVVSFSRLEAVTTPWLATWLSARVRVSPSLTWDRRTVRN